MADLETIRTADEFLNLDEYDEVMTTYVKLVIDALGVPGNQIMTFDSDADGKTFDKFMPLLDEARIVSEFKGGSNKDDDRFNVYVHKLGKFIFSETWDGKLMAFWIPKELFDAFLKTNA